MAPLKRRLLLVLALVLHLVAGIFYLGSGLLVPEEVVLFLWAVWVLLLAVLVWLWSRRPKLAPLVPVGAIVLLYAVVTVGDVFLGWTA